MLSIKRSQVPTYLCGSALFTSLDDEDDEEFTIPADCFKMDLSLNSIDDVSSLLKTLRFWCAPKQVPIELVSFAITHDVKLYKALFLDYKNEFALEGIIYMLETPPSDRVAAAARITYRIEILELLLQSGHPWTNSSGTWTDWSVKIGASEAAAAAGNLLFLKYGHEHGFEWTHATTNAAAKNGHYDCLKYAHEHGCSHDDFIGNNAAMGGLDCLRYVHDHIQDISLGGGICNWAASAGKVESLKYAHALGCEWSENTCSAAVGESVECLKYLHENGCPWDQYTIAYCFDKGYMDCLAYAHEHGCPWPSADMVHQAVISPYNGRVHSVSLECLIYCTTHGSPLYQDTCTLAARDGHLDRLIYAHTHGYHWDLDTFESALSGLHMRCVLYMLMHNCPNAYISRDGVYIAGVYVAGGLFIAFAYQNTLRFRHVYSAVFAGGIAVQALIRPMYNKYPNHRMFISAVDWLVCGAISLSIVFAVHYKII